MTQIAEFFAKIKGDNTDLKAKLAETKTQLGGVGDAFQKMTGISLTSAGLTTAAIGLAVKGVQELIKYYKEGTEKLLAYEDAVETFANSSGLATDAAQQWVIMAQRLDVSQQALAKGMKELSLNGIAPTIENVSKLADQYRAIQDPTERATFLNENFGRSGVEIAKVFELSGTELKKLNEEIQKNSVLTARQMAIVSDMEAATNRLKISEEQLQKLRAVQIAPTQTAIMKNNIEYNERLSARILIEERLKESLKSGLITQKEYNNLLVSIQIAQGFTGDATKETAYAIEFLDEKVRENASDIQAATISYQDAVNMLHQWKQGVEQAGQALDDFKAKTFDFKIDFNIESEIDKFFKEEEYNKLGGLIGENITDGLITAIKSGDIPKAVGTDLLKQVKVINEKIAVEMGDKTIYQAALDVSKDMGVSFNEAYTMLSNIKDTLAAMQGLNLAYDVWITKHERTIVENWRNDWGSGGQMGDWKPPEELANGGSFQVPSSFGYEGFQMGGIATASGGETVTVTPAGQGNTTELSQRALIDLKQALKDAVMESRG